MQKTSIEKTIEKQTKERKKSVIKQLQANQRIIDKQQKEERRKAELESRARQAASIVNNQSTIGRVKILDKVSEELVSIICSSYDRNENYVVKSQDVVLPVYLQNDLNLEFEKLKQYGLISRYSIYITGAWDICILPSLLSYMEDKERAMMEDRSAKTQVSIGNIYATNGNVVIGNVVNSNLNIDNSIQNLQEKVDRNGGEEKEELYALLEELRDVIEDIQETRRVPKNKGFFNRLVTHLDKHGWFYAEVVSLLGGVALHLLQA